VGSVLAAAPPLHLARPPFSGRSILPFRGVRTPALALAAVGLLASALPAQKEAGYGRSYVIEADAAWVAPGKVVAPAFLSIQDGVIQGVSRQKPRGGGGLLGFGGGGAKVLKVKGTLAAGVVDAWSGLVPAAFGDSRHQPSWATVADGLPRDMEGADTGLVAEILAARNSGIAAAFLGNPASQLRRGTGTPVLFSGRNLPRPGGDAALEFALGSARRMGAGGLLESDGFKGVFEEAVEWRDSVDEHVEKMEKYEKDLEAYQEKLDEFVEKKEKEKKEGEEAAAAKDENGEDAKKKGKEKKDEMPKRPKRPKTPSPRTARNQVLGAIDGDFQVRVHAHSVADIRAAVEVALEHHLDLVVVGGLEADLVAETLADAEIPVILSIAGGGEQDRALSQRWARLQDAGVEVALSSGGARGGYALLLLRAGELVAAGANSDAVWASLTTIPARLLGLSGKAGRLVSGATGSVVLFEGSSPFDASASFRSHIPK
jgi:hypothetical protein